jgi:hypothetical protein
VKPMPSCPALVCQMRRSSLENGVHAAAGEPLGGKPLDIGLHYGVTRYLSTLTRPCALTSLRQTHSPQRSDAPSSDLLGVVLAAMLSSMLPLIAPDNRFLSPTAR